MPRQLRPHVAAVYAFARAADDVATSLAARPPNASPCWPSTPAPVPATRRVAVTRRSLFLPALFRTHRPFNLDTRSFTDLLSAFEQDVVTTRYAAWEDVLDYCRRSANPIGRLVLRLSGYHRDDLDRASDAICTALQLTNFWQDLAIDWSRGRLYVPEEEWRRHAADPADLDGRRWTAAWRATPRAATGRRASSRPAARSATASRAASATNSVPPGSGARASSPASKPAGSTSSATGPRSAPPT